MNRATKWDWIMAWVGVLLAFAIIGYVSRLSDECKAKGGVYAKVWNQYGYRCIVERP